MTTDRTQHVIDAIDGALDDYAVSDDAMRWSPQQPTRIDRKLPGRHPVFVVRGGTPEAAAIFEYLNDPEVRARLAAAVQATWERIVELLRPVVQHYADAMASLGEQLRAAGVLPAAVLPEDPRAHALQLRQHRNTGPARPAGERAKRPRRLG